MHGPTEARAHTLISNNKIDFLSRFSLSHFIFSQTSSAFAVVQSAIRFLWNFISWKWINRCKRVQVGEWNPHWASRHMQVTGDEKKKHFQLNYFGLLKEFNINRMNTILLLNATIWIQCGKIFESSHGICEILYTMFCTVRVLYGCIRWEMEFGNRWSVFTHSHSKHSLHFSIEKWNKFQQISIAIRFEKSNAFLFFCMQIIRYANIQMIQFNSPHQISSIQYSVNFFSSLLFAVICCGLHFMRSA